MKEMCESERPRERLLRQGAEALSDGELLAVLIGSGTRERSALELGRGLLSECGGLPELFSMTLQELRAVRGLGAVRSVILLAAMELGRRFVEADASVSPSRRVSGPEDAYRMMIPRLKGLRHEECWALFLNHSNVVLGREMICTGCVDSTLIDVRRIVKSAMDRNATGIIVLHNHPSGNPRPSGGDISRTRELRDACIPFGISLLDHVIVCDASYYSFTDECSSR